MNTAVMYGATTTGKRIYEEVKTKYDVQYFVDGNPELVGTQIENLEVKSTEKILETKLDVVIMGILTGYQDAVEYLVNNGFSEEKIICKYVDLNYRAKRECLEKIAIILSEKCLEGAVAELGVYRGEFAKVINEVFPDRKLYLFDTFEGFPEQDMNYDIANGLLLYYGGKYANTSVEYVLGRMPYPENCIIRQGYFPDTAAGLEEEQYAFVNIDVDLYKPILAGLEYFYPRMIKGGYLLVHDYFAFSYTGTRKAINEFAEKYDVKFTPIGDTSSIAFVKN